MTKKLLTFLTLLTLFFGVGWAETSSLIFTAKCNGSGTADDGTIWTVTSDGTESNFDNTSGIHYGTNNAQVQYLQLSTSGISGTIKKVEVNARDAQANAAITVTVGGTSFLYNGQTSAIGANYSFNYEFNGSASGQIVVRIDRGTKQYKAIYVKSVVVTYEAGGSGEQDPVAPSGTITFTPAAGEVTSGTTVAMSFSGTCTGIKYTTNGDTPDATHGTVYDASNPPAITGATTIKAAAYNYSNSKYAFGSVATAEYTVTIPSVDYDGTATFVAGTDVGTSTGQNHEDEIVKSPITFHSTNAALATAQYRLYSGSETTFSVPEGSGYKIVKIEFTGTKTGTETSRPLTNLSTTIGNYTATELSGTWTGEAESVMFIASAQTRATLINVYYTAPTSSGPEYYLVGTFNNWTQNADYKFFENNGTFTLDNVSLPVNAQFKIIKVDNGTTWYGGTGNTVYNLHHRHHTNLPMNGDQNYTIQSAGTTSFSFTLDNNTPTNLNVNRTASLAIKGDFTDNWTEVPMTATEDGWTTTQTVAVNNEFGFVDEFGQYIDILWTVGTEHLGTNIPMTTDGGYTVGNYKMGIAGTYKFTANNDLTSLVITDASQGGDGDIYTLVESEDDLVAGEEYLIVGSTAAAPYSAILGPWPASGNYATAVKNNFTYNATDKTIILESGCTATPLTLGGSAGAWTFNNGSGFLAYTSTATSGSNNLWTVQNASNDGATWTIDTNKLPSSTALIVNVNNTSRKLNYNNDRFAGYVNAQSAVALFKKTSASSTSKAPVITPESGNIVGYSQEVTMTQSNGGNIYYTYTTDGTEPADPTEASTPYNSQNKFWAEVQNLGDEVWIKAVAKEGTKDLSSVVSVKYRFVSPKNPVFDPKAGTYSSAQSVSITTATEGAKVYYTTNANLAPAEIVAQGTEYTEPIIVTANTTFYAVSAYYDAHAERNAISSNKVTAAYVIVGEDDVVHVQNIAEFNSLETGLKAQFDNPVTVLYDYSQRSYSSQLQETTYQEYIWVKDETGFTQIYLRPSLNSNNTESKQTAFYENGDVIPAGFIVDKQLYETGQYVQAYSERAGEDPTLPGNNVEAGFFASTQKALADPEPMTAAQLAELTANEDNIATYNNRYISISKIKITSKNNKNFNFTDENGNGSNIAGYNKYSDATSYQKSGESAVVTVPDVSNTAYYDVTAILQVWQNGWEIMPIEFTEWKVDEVTLRKLCAEGNVGTEYTISNRLQCVYIQGNKLWVKDDNGQSILKKAPAEGDNNYEIGEEAGNKQLDQSLYDQSNWLEVHLADGSANAETFYRHIIKGGAITGTFTNKTNPTMENVVLTSTALENSDEIGGTVEYAPNYYCAANFYNGIEGGNQACIGSQHHGDFFFMNPKPQEYAMIVWAKYDGNNTFSVPAGEGANEHGFNGEFEVNMSMNSNPNFSPTTGKAYKFEAIVRRIESTGNTLRANKSNDYIVYPLTLSDEVVTGINNVTGKAVAGVKYYNLAGMESDRPFEGVNIIVTTYTDGSRSSAKVLK